VRSAAERGETENLRVMFVRQVIDTPEDRKVWVDLVFGGGVYERVILDVKIRSAKIKFLVRIHELILDTTTVAMIPKRLAQSAIRGPWATARAPCSAWRSGTCMFIA